MRIEKYTSCYIMQNWQGNFKEFAANAQTPIEYLFDEHAFCDVSWCWAKETDEKVEEIMSIRRPNSVRITQYMINKCIIDSSSLLYLPLY